MKNKHILIVTPIFPPDIGGPASYVTTLVKKLPNSLEYKIITFSSTTIPKKVDSEKPKSSASKIFRVSISHHPIIRQLQLIKAIIDNHNWADLCYVQGTLTVGFATFIACKLMHKPYIIKFVGDEVWEGYQTKGGTLNLIEFLEHTKNIKLWLNKMILKNAKTVITPGKYLQMILKTYYQVDANNIPNAVTASDPPDLPVSKISNSIVTIGRLVPWKNFEQVIEALALLKKNAPHKTLSTPCKSNPYQLTIVGEGPELPKLQTLVKNLNLEKQITFVGKLTQAATFQLLKKSVYCILYSSYEGLSHTLLEAMLAKTRIIASNIPANADLLENGKLGKLVELNSPQKLAESIRDSFDNQIVGNAYTAVSTIYTWKQHVNQLLKTFNE